MVESMGIERVENDDVAAEKETEQGINRKQSEPFP